MFDETELHQFIEQANYISVNDYEGQLLCEKTNLSVDEIAAKVKAFIITKGSQGSDIYTNGEKISIDPIKIDQPVDPTGCGDAYRAGLIYGIAHNMDWQSTGRLASVMGAIKIKSEGGQNHQPKIDDIENLFGQKLS